MIRKLSVLAAAVAVTLPVLAGSPPVPYVMSGGDYSEGFGDIANWTADFAGGIGAGPWGSVATGGAGTIPNGVKTTAATTTFASGGTGGVQKGTGNIVLLATGTTDNSAAAAIDLLLDFTGRNAGTLTFDYAEINNSTGNRAGSVRVYTSTDGTTFTELTAAAVLNLSNNVAVSGTISAVALPAAFNGSAMARIRFYYHNGAGGTTGSRPKISLDNVAVTSTGYSAPLVTVPPASRTNYTGETATFTVSGLDATGYQSFHGTTVYANGGNVSGATSSTLSLSNVAFADAVTNITVVLSNAFGYATSTPPASLTVLATPQTAFKLMDYNVDGNSIAGTDPTNWATTAPQVQAIGRQLMYHNPDIVTFNEIPIAYEFQMTNWVNAYLPGYYLATNAQGDGSIENFIVSRYPILSSASHLHTSSLLPFGYTGSGFARDLFEAQIDVPGLGAPLHVFVAHLKATLGGTEHDDADKRAAEAKAVSNYLATVFLPSTNGSHLYFLAGDMNEDIIRPETSKYTTGHPIQTLTNGTGLFLTTPVNPVTGTELTESIRGSLNVRFDYIMPCGVLYSNIVLSQVFRTDVLSPVPAGLNSNDDIVSSDHLPLVMIFQNPYATVPPGIVVQPVSRTNNLNTAASFSVTAAGATPLAYQWQKGGVDLVDDGNYSGVTNSTLNIANVTQLEEGAYTVLVTNIYGATVSSNAILTVTTPSQTITLWNFNSVVPDANSGTGTNVPSTGSGTAALVGGVTATFAGGSSQDPAASDNTGWNLTSYAAQGTSNKLRGVQFGTSTAGFRNITVSYFERHSSTASRYMRFQYSTNGTDFIDADVSTFTVDSAFQLQQHDLTGVAGVDNNPSFACRIVAELESTAITNANPVYTGTSGTYGTGGTVRFDMLTIGGQPLAAPGVTAPLDVVTQAGGTATFAVTATGTTPFGYQWRKGGSSLADGGNIAGALSATLILTNVAAGDAGNYTVVVTNVAGAVTSSVAMLTVTCPVITLNGTLPGGTTGTAYTNTVTGSGGSAPYTYAVTGGSVPAGLSLTAGGSLEGTPTAAGGSGFTITATDSHGCTGSSNYSVAISCPTITLAQLAGSVAAGSAYSSSAAASGGTAPYTYGVSSGALPGGLGLNSSSGLVSGTASNSGVFSFTVTATALNGCSGSSNYSITVTCPTITLGQLTANATPGAAYSASAAASGGTATYGYAVSVGALPGGLSLNTGSGLVSGTATNSGVFIFTVTATDTNNCSGSSNYSITVSCPTITLGAVPNAGVTVAYSHSIGASGGTSAYNFGVTGGGLPAGFTLDTNGLLHGSSATPGTTNFTVTATDANSCTGASNYTFSVGCPTITLSAIPNASKGVKYLTTVTASGGVAPYTYAVTAGSPPSGLSFTNSTAKLGGKPTVYGMGTFTITATDSNGCTGSQSYTVLVNKASGDTKAPTIKFTVLKPNIVLTNPPVPAGGTATDDVLVTNVAYTVDGGAVTAPTSFTVSNKSAFAISVPGLANGVHTIAVIATDLSGNKGTNAVTFNYGTNSFLDLAGTYFGLFNEMGGVQFQSAGFAQIKVTAKPSKLPTFSAKLTVDGKTWNGAGTFLMNGIGTLKKPVDRSAQSGKGQLTVRLMIPFDGSKTISGSVYSTNAAPLWTSPLEGDLAIFTSKLPAAGALYNGTYTLVVPSPTNDIGDGFSYLLITNGAIKLSGGKLATGQGFSVPATSLSQNGDWPLFSSGDKNSGIYQSMLIGWVSVSTNHSITTSNLVWINKAGITTYASGFTNNVGLQASTYNGNFGGGLVFMPDGLNPAHGVVTLVGGNLTTNILNPMTLANDGVNKNKFTDGFTNKLYKLTLKLSATKGTLTGTFQAPGAGVAKANIYGAVLQSSNKAHGYFLLNPGGTKSGTFKLE